jgi:hypothetical protein
MTVGKEDRMKRIMIRMLGLLMLIALVSVSAAFAGPVSLRLSNDGVNWITVPDNSGLDIDPTTGEETYVGTVGNWQINVSTGLGSAVLSPGHMDLDSVDSSIFQGNPQSLYIEFSETNISGAFGSFGTSFGGTNQNTTSVFNAYYSMSNALFATDSLISTLGPYGPPAIGFSGSSNTPGSPNGTYSLTAELIINPINDSQTQKVLHAYSGNTALDAPEPSTLVLLAFSLLAVGLVIVRRQNAFNA